MHLSQALGGLHMPLHLCIGEQGEGPGNREGNGIAGDSHILLGLQNGIEDGSHRSTGEGTRMHLQVRLVGQDQGFQGRMISCQAL